MAKLLKIIGILTAIVTVIAGIVGAVESDSLLVFTICLISGIIQAIVYYAMARVLENQEEMQWRLRNMELLLQSQNKETTEKRKCPCCGRSYEIDRDSCPYCGYKG